MDLSFIPSLIDKVFQTGGIFGALFSVLLGAILFFVWKIGSKISNKSIETMESISTTNAKFADSSIKMAELIKILVDQTQATLDQLKFIKSQLNKQNNASIEFMGVLKSIISRDEKKDPETILRIENVIKELQRHDGE